MKFDQCQIIWQLESNEVKEVYFLNFANGFERVKGGIMATGII